MNQKPIFLLGAHKSGTSLLRSIFNGHSQLYTLPIETHFFQNMHYWVDNDYRSERPKILSRDKLIENFCKAINHYNTSKDIYSDSLSNGILDEINFKNYFSKINKDDPLKSIIEKYFEAIHFSVTGTNLPENIRVVEKSVEHAEFAAELHSMFPDASFIHIIRNPYANIVSLRRFKSISHGFPIVGRILRTLYNNYYFMYKNQKLIPNYYIIKYEELICNPEITIKKLCSFINIPFEEILLQPTYQATRWSGNSTRDYSYSKIDSSQMNAWQQEILPMEIEYINRLFPFIFDDYNFELLSVKGSIWKMGKGESIKRYLANRFYKFYLPKYKM